jgi:hypothetical protein
MKHVLKYNAAGDVPQFVFNFVNRIFDLAPISDTNLYSTEFRKIRDEMLEIYGGTVLFHSTFMIFEFESEEHAEVFILAFS